MKLIDKDAAIAEIDKRIKVLQKHPYENHKMICHLDSLKQSLNTLEVKEVDVSKISENLAEAHSYLDLTTTWNFAHNKPMVSARLKWAIRGLFDAGLFKLTHDEKYRMENLGLKAQKEEYRGKI